MLVELFVLTAIVFQASAIYCAWRAIASARTPQGAVGWVVFLISAPVIGVILYAFLGHHQYRGYLISRRTSESVIEGLKVLADTERPPIPPVVDPTPFERIADLPAVRGNALKTLVDGTETFDAIFAAIDAAQSYVLVQFFIVHDDELGRQLQKHLVGAAARGVSVRFMTDSIGSKSLPESYYEALRKAGVDVVDPRSGNRPKHRLQMNFRNHRKTVVVDGETGFIGGHNVGDEYMGRDPKFGHWRDTHAELRGPVVSQLQLVFAEDWHWLKGEAILGELNWRPKTAGEDMTALLVPTGPGDEMETGSLFFFTAISAAKSRVWIASPYCVPDIDILTALKHAGLKGLDVRLLVPDVVDHTIPWLAAFAYFDELRAAGVQIWRYTDGFMHQKVVLVDDTCAAIGTTNLDNRSFRLNFEAMVIGFDAGFAGDVESFLRNDFGNTSLLEKSLPEQPVHICYGAPIARLFAPLL